MVGIVSQTIKKKSPDRNRDFYSSDNAPLIPWRHGFVFWNRDRLPHDSLLEDDSHCPVGLMLTVYHLIVSYRSHDPVLEDFSRVVNGPCEAD